VTWFGALSTMLPLRKCLSFKKKELETPLERPRLVQREAQGVAVIRHALMNPDSTGSKR
jgi:hypothetical protein